VDANSFGVALKLDDEANENFGAVVPVFED